MNIDAALARLDALADDRGRAHAERTLAGSGLRALGIGLTALRKLGKELGRDHELAAALWAQPLYEARVLALLVEDPRRLSRAQAEAQVEQVGAGQLAHVFASCDAALAKTPFARELAEEWTQADHPLRRACGWGLVYELSKDRTKKAPEDAAFEAWIRRIDQTRHEAAPDLRLAMATALMGIGKRDARLNALALAVARAMGPVDWDPTGACEPFDAVKHLDNDRLRAALGLSA